MYIVGVMIVFFGTAVSFYLKGVPLTTLVNPAAIVVLLCAFIGVIAATSGFKTFLRGLRAVLSVNYALDDETREKAARLFRLLSKAAVLASLLVFLVGVIGMTRDLNDLEMVAHVLASALTGPVLGLLGSLAIFEPAAFVLRKPPNASTNNGQNAL